MGAPQLVKHTSALRIFCVFSPFPFCLPFLCSFNPGWCFNPQETTWRPLFTERCVVSARLPCYIINNNSSSNKNSNNINNNIYRLYLYIHILYIYVYYTYIYILYIYICILYICVYYIYMYIIYICVYYIYTRYLHYIYYIHISIFILYIYVYTNIYIYTLYIYVYFIYTLYIYICVYSLWMIIILGDHSPLCELHGPRCKALCVTLPRICCWSVLASPVKSGVRNGGGTIKTGNFTGFQGML